MVDYSALSDDDFREKLLARKPYLKTLYNLALDKNYSALKKHITHATDSEVNLLLCIIQRIYTGSIKISKMANTRVNRSKRAGALFKKMRNDEFFQKLLWGPREDQINFLHQFGLLYGDLLQYLFVRKAA